MGTAIKCVAFAAVMAGLFGWLGVWLMDVATV